MTFGDLQWFPHLGGIAAEARLPNGVVASVIRHNSSYGGRDGKYELMYTEIPPTCGEQNYGPFGWLGHADVTAHLQKAAGWGPPPPPPDIEILPIRRLTVRNP